MKETKVEDYRIEKDSIGTRDIPGDVYYGVQSLRAAENFHITGLRMHPEIINSLAYIKKAAAITNCEVGMLEKRKAQAEINLPAKQNGSSIMPGKINPVIPEVVNQVAFNIIGNDVTITMAAEAGQLELNAFEPIVFYCMFQSIDTLAYAVHTFVENCVTGITANETRCRYLVENSVGIITAICPYVGYQKAADIAKKAIKTGASVRDLILQENLLDKEQMDSLLDPFHMTEPGTIRGTMDVLNKTL